MKKQIVASGFAVTVLLAGAPAHAFISFGFGGGGYYPAYDYVYSYPVYSYPVYYAPPPPPVYYAPPAYGYYSYSYYPASTYYYYGSPGISLRLF